MIIYSLSGADRELAAAVLHWMTINGSIKTVPLFSKSANKHQNECLQTARRQTVCVGLLFVSTLPGNQSQALGTQIKTYATICR